MVVLANLLTNADARSQFWYQSELIEALATTITVSHLSNFWLDVVWVLIFPALLSAGSRNSPSLWCDTGGGEHSGGSGT